MPRFSRTYRSVGDALSVYSRPSPSQKDIIEQIKAKRRRDGELSANMASFLEDLEKAEAQGVTLAAFRGAPTPTQQRLALC